MVDGNTSHHILMESIIIYDAPETFPYMNENHLFLIVTCDPFLGGVVLLITKLDKVTKCPCVFNVCIV